MKIRDVEKSLDQLTKARFAVNSIARYENEVNEYTLSLLQDAVVCVEKVGYDLRQELLRVEGLLDK